MVMAYIAGAFVFLAIAVLPSQFVNSGRKGLSAVHETRANTRLRNARSSAIEAMVNKCNQLEEPKDKLNCVDNISENLKADGIDNKIVKTEIIELDEYE